MVIYKQTVLGFLWAILNPLFMMIIFSLIFSKLAQMPSDGIPYPIFNYAALLPWTYFSQALGGSTNSLIANSHIFTKVYFPRLFIPLSAIASKLVDFFIAFSILIIMMFIYDVYPSINLVFLPALIILLVIFSSGLGFWLSALSIKYRDIKFTLPFLMQIMLFAAPVVYPASLVKQKSEMLYLLYGLYPLSGIIEGFRSSLLGQNPMPWDLLAIGTVSAVLIFISGAYYFRKTENIFADIV